MARGGFKTPKSVSFLNFCIQGVRYLTTSNQIGYSVLSTLCQELRNDT